MKHVCGSDCDGKYEPHEIDGRVNRNNVDGGRALATIQHLRMCLEDAFVATFESRVAERSRVADEIMALSRAGVPAGVRSAIRLLSDRVRGGLV